MSLAVLADTYWLGDGGARRLRNLIECKCLSSGAEGER
jgi:hypothetical protein